MDGFFKILEKWGLLGLASFLSIFYLGDKYKGLQRCNAIHKEVDDKMNDNDRVITKKVDDMKSANEREFGGIKAQLQTLTDGQVQLNAGMLELLKMVAKIDRR